MNIQVISAIHVTATEKKHIKKLLETGHTQAKINTKYYCILKGVPIQNGYQYTIVINTPYKSERTNETKFSKQTIEIIVKK